MGAYETNLERLKRVADKMGLILNPNEARVQRVVGQMSDFFNSMGEYVCPCKQANNPPVKGKEVLCPCAELAEEIKRQGRCHCRLFYSPNQPAVNNRDMVSWRHSIDKYPVAD